MKKWSLVFLALVFVLCLFGCSKEVSYYQPQLQESIQTGDWAQLKKYPLLRFGKMSEEKIKELGLSKVTLKEPLNAYNFKGKKNWWLEELPSGTEVAVDKNGRPWYKVSCGNRLFVPTKTDLKWIRVPKRTLNSFIPAPGTQVPGTPAIGPAAPPSTPIAKASFTDWFWWLFLIPLLLVLLVAAAWTIWHMITHWAQQTTPAQLLAPHPTGGPAAPWTVPGPQPNENGIGIFHGPNGMRIINRGQNEVTMQPNGTFTVTIH
jgi:hypothetical protein